MKCNCKPCSQYNKRVLARQQAKNQRRNRKGQFSNGNTEEDYKEIKEMNKRAQEMAGNFTFINPMSTKPPVSLHKKFNSKEFIKAANKVSEEWNDTSLNGRITKLEENLKNLTQAIEYWYRCWI